MREKIHESASYAVLKSSDRRQSFMIQVLLAMALLLFAPRAALSWEELEDEDYGESSSQEYYGVSCARLVELSYEELKALIHHRNREHFREFCIPDDLLNCSDYNIYLYGLGFLKRQDSYSCQFIPNRK